MDNVIFICPLNRQLLPDLNILDRVNGEVKVNSVGYNGITYCNERIQETYCQILLLILYLNLTC